MSMVRTRATRAQIFFIGVIIVCMRNVLEVDGLLLHIFLHYHVLLFLNAPILAIDFS